MNDTEVLEAVNRCQITEMAKKGKELDPLDPVSCDIFSYHVRDMSAAIIHTYQLTAFKALREEDPSCAAKLWKRMSSFCDEALKVLKALKDTYPKCGTPELYNLALDYKNEADKRHYQNAEDAECAENPSLKKLFPSAT